jgi:iron complex transport system ATP-binding protein
MMAVRPANLSCSGLSAGYEGRAVVREISCDLVPGEVTGLIGPNGAGKSTILQALGGLLRPFSGEVRLQGQLLASYPGRARARQIAVITQSRAPDFPFTVRELVEQGRYPHLGPFRRLAGDDVAAVEQALAATGLRELAERRVDTLSLGECQRAWLARGLAQEAEILLLDEPAAHLDAAFEAVFAGVLRGLADQGRAILCAVHDLNLAARMCDRLILLSRGQLAAQGGPAEVLTASNLQTVYGGEPMVTAGADGFPVVIFRPQS